MAKVKDMPCEEKFAIVTENIEFDETFILPFLRKQLSEQSVVELERLYQEGTKPIPEKASPEEKYELAYSNWIWLVKNVYKFIRKNMGEEGIKKFERTDVDELKRKNSGPGLLTLISYYLFCLKIDVEEIS